MKKPKEKRFTHAKTVERKLAESSEAQPQDTRLVALDFGLSHVIEPTIITRWSPGFFTPFRLIIPAHIADGFGVFNVYVGQKPQHIFKDGRGRPGALAPGLVFTPHNYSPPMVMNRSQPTDKIAISIAPSDQSVRVFEALMIGWADTSTPLASFAKGEDFFCEEIANRTPDRDEMLAYSKKLLDEDSPIVAANPQEFSIIERWLAIKSKKAMA